MSKDLLKKLQTGNLAMENHEVGVVRHKLQRADQPQDSVPAYFVPNVLAGIKLVIVHM